MENSNASFFHMFVGASLFVMAVVVFLLGVRSVEQCVGKRQAEFSKRVLYETTETRAMEPEPSTWRMYDEYEIPGINVCLEE